MSVALKSSRITEGWKQLFFSAIHSNTLVYNTSWEDPRIDRELLNLQPDSSVVMITSAGCNVLDYVLDSPAKIHTVDVNPRQNALLELKIAALRLLDHDEVFELFGSGKHQEASRIFDDILMPELSGFTKSFWEKKQKWFHPETSKNLYFRGSSGAFARFMVYYLSLRPDLKNKTDHLFASTTLEEQTYWYNKIEPDLWTPLRRWLINRHVTMSFLGVPKPQQNLINHENPLGISQFLERSLRHVFTVLPIADNYFWRVYLYGSYTKSCCPEYLKAEHQPLLRNAAEKVEIHTSTLSGFLKDNPGTYTHFILLDHQDWLAWKDPAALREEWELILKNAAPSAKILFRSAGSSVPFLPDFVHKQTKTNTELCANAHSGDRVGTYASLHLHHVI